MADTGRRPANPPLFQALREDARELGRLKSVGRAARPEGGSALAGGGAVDIATLPGFWCVVLWRLGNCWHERGLRPLSRLAYLLNLVLFGADLHPGAVVGPGMVIPHPVGVAIADDVVFGAGCRVMGLVRLGGSGRPGLPGHPVIGDDVWLLDGARIFGPVHVGDRTVVSATTTLTEDVPADSYVSRPTAPVQIRPRRHVADESAKAPDRSEPQAATDPLGARP